MIFPRTHQTHGPGCFGGATLAALCLLLFAPALRAQISVQTVGGGPKTQCGSASGFKAGLTYSQAQFNNPYATALDSQGDLWVADVNNSDVEQITQAGNRSTSSTYQVYSGTNYHVFPNVIGVAVDANNNLYVLTSSYLYAYDNVTGSFPNLNILYRVQLNLISSGTPTALTVVNDANTNIYISFVNGSTGSIVRIPQPLSNYYDVVQNYPFAPAGLSLRTDGQLAVSDTLNDGIYAVPTATGSTPTLLTGGTGAGFVNGAPQYAKFNQPHGIAASGDGRMVVADTANNYVRLIDSSNNTTTLYGTPSNVWISTPCTANPPYYAGWVDGTPGNTSGSATGRLPVSVTIGSNGTVFVTEQYYDLIRTVSGTGLTPVNGTNSYVTTTNVPVVTTLAATGLNGTNATLNAGVIPEGSPATVYFVLFPNTTNAVSTSSTIITNNLGSSNSVTYLQGGLTPGEVYSYQAVAYNNGGTAYGQVRQFSEPAIAPTVTTLAPTSISSAGATANGTINPNDAATTYYFEYGTTTNYGNFTQPGTVQSTVSNAGTAQSVTASLAGLSAGTTYHIQLVGSNSAGSALGGDLTFVTQPTTPVVSISPSSGYFPECETIVITSSVTNAYYTEDGSTPTTNSTPVVFSGATNSSGFYVGTIQWCNAQSDLTGLQVIAYNAGITSAVVSGTGSPSNQIGFVTGPTNGIGSTAYIPIVLNLQSNTTVKSLQFRVEVTANAGAASDYGNYTPNLGFVPITSNDFVQLIGPAPGNAPVAFSTFNYTNTASPNGLGMYVYTGASSGMNIQHFGVVGLLQFQVPGDTPIGATYNLKVLYPSGTSDGIASNVPMTAMSNQVLAVNNLTYLAGDSAPAYGYNAREFGDGYLENADYNNAFYASMGIRVPPLYSDAFNALDVWPQTAFQSGNLKIDINDVYHILLRSLGFESNWLRSWSAGGSLTASTTANGLIGGNPGDPTQAALPAPPPGLVWDCQASIVAGTLTNVAPGAVCSVPVYVNVTSGNNLSGLQFRSVVGPNGSAPAVASAQFVLAHGLPSATWSHIGLGSNDLLTSWLPPTLNLQSTSNYIGSIQFQVPNNAAPGQCYAVHFTGVSGTPDGDTEYSMESFPGYVWVQSAALQPPSVTSDEWKLQFFGSLTNAIAADDADPDGDGCPNWQEYLAGTDPSNPSSVLSFDKGGAYATGPNGVTLSWLTAPNKTYILESIPAIGGKTWTAINTNTGDGYTYKYTQSKINSSAAFYRLCLHP